MKFRQIKRFFGETGEQAAKWLRDELNSLLRELYVGLEGLSFADNFKSYEWSGTLGLSETKQIPHPFGKLPSGYIIFRQVGNAVVDASETLWTTQVAYLRNNSSTDTVEVTVIFFA